MFSYQITASARVPAPAGRVYAVLADYREGHPRILPPRHFHGLEVEQGGTGAGTVARFAMTVLGRTRRFRVSVSEPEPGRVLAETDLDTGVVTRFTVSPAGARESDVTIATELPARAGLAGAVEALLTRRLLGRIYAEELARLGAYAGAEGAARR